MTLQGENKMVEKRDITRQSGSTVLTHIVREVVGDVMKVVSFLFHIFKAILRLYLYKSLCD